MESRRPSVLIVAAKWWPLSARLGAALLRDGCRVSVHCPAGHPLTVLSGLQRVTRYSGVRSLSSLSSAIKSSSADIIVPGDDGVVSQLHALHGQEAALRDIIERSLGDPDSYPVTGSRFNLLSVARELGIAIPETRRVTGENDLKPWRDGAVQSGVLKVDGETGGNGVWLCASREELLCALRKAGERRSFAAACKRLLIDGDPLALWTRKVRARDITVQRMIFGRPANSMMVCSGGKLLAHVAVVVLASEGPTGASTIVQRVCDERIERAAALLTERLQLTGFYGLDFMIEAATGTPHLIEMNPRCTQLGHIEFPGQRSLAAAFSAHLRGESPSAAHDPIPIDTVALYPQALVTLNSGSRYRHCSHLDVPLNEPRLAREIKLGPLPQRRWPARLYHALRPVASPAPTEFDPIVFEQEIRARSAVSS